ncbi:nascent polypeptide-associated complex subunit alpha, muscle-specific form [Ischnura elegans]|uniref:nascent polypeptide-associated complex subunit alpha, muscle-specific form n=1 Tax=Ischnura elegans TaxID=197161 RepID=UPI001ED876C7|nr:nascent polypeptide-associated complex subunit alpha, muscle-specific form [Ischnura elegans]
MSNDCQCIMDVDSPVSSSSANLKRCNSAPMINELNTTMSTTTSTTNTASRDSYAFNIFSREQPRTRRFSASFSPLLQSPLISSGIGGRASSSNSTGSDSPPDPSSPPPSPTPPPPRGLAPRVTQLRQEGRLLVDVAGVRVREAAHERELNSAMQISRSWEDLTLLTPSSSAPSSNSASPPNTNPTFSPGGHPLHPPSSTPPPHPLPLSPSNVSSPLAIQPRVDGGGSGKCRAILDPLHVHLPPSSCGSLFSASSPFSHLSLSSPSTPTTTHHATCPSPLASPSSSFPSPTRPGFSGRQCFSPGSHAIASPSPTRKAFATRRSLSPIAMRPSSLGPVKRKFELGEASEEKSPVGANVPVASALVGVGSGGMWDHQVYPPAKRSNLGLLVTNSVSRVFPVSSPSASGDSCSDGSSSIGFAFRPVGTMLTENLPRDPASVACGDSDPKSVVAMETGGSVSSSSLDGKGNEPPPSSEEGRSSDMMETEKESNAQPTDESMTAENVKNSEEAMKLAEEEGSVGSR